MNILKKILGWKKKEKESGFQKDFSNENGLGVGLSLKTISKEKEGYNISISGTPVGDKTGSTATDFYVYEWFIKSTGEIFYVGKGRGDRYKVFHERAHEAEKIRKKFETAYRFIGTELTEDQAIELESAEIERILNETDDRLTNRIIPLFSKRGNGYDPSPTTPELQFEKAPHFYASEIDEHYFDIQARSFDEVDFDELRNVVFLSKNLRDEVSVIYGNDLDKYYEETIELLTTNNHKILKSKYAKSVTAWIYIGDDSVLNYERDQQLALERIGRHIPAYHLVDVWKTLKEKYGELNIAASVDKISPSNATHNRVALEDIKNRYNWSKGLEAGMPYWEEGDKERKSGNLVHAIELFDQARYNGYNAPALYKSYAMAYRKLKDYGNEVLILDEAIERLQEDNLNINNTLLIELKDRRAKALILNKS